MHNCKSSEFSSFTVDMFILYGFSGSGTLSLNANAYTSLSMG